MLNTFSQDYQLGLMGGMVMVSLLLVLENAQGSETAPEPESEEVAIDLDDIEEEGSKKKVAVAAEEEVIDLDALDEEEAGGAAPQGFQLPDEPMLPIELTEIEQKRQPFLKMAALLVLLPLGAMLFRTRRRGRRRPKK